MGVDVGPLLSGDRADVTAAELAELVRLARIGADASRGLPESAWETWREAGAAFARESAGKGIVDLGEAAATYAASRGLNHQCIIRRAFTGGYWSAWGE